MTDRKKRKAIRKIADQRANGDITDEEMTQALAKLNEEDEEKVEEKEPESPLKDLSKVRKVIFPAKELNTSDLTCACLLALIIDPKVQFVRRPPTEKEEKDENVMVIGGTKAEPELNNIRHPMVPTIGVLIEEIKMPGFEPIVKASHRKSSSVIEDTFRSMVNRFWDEDQLRKEVREILATMGGVMVEDAEARIAETAKETVPAQASQAA